MIDLWVAICSLFQKYFDTSRIIWNKQFLKLNSDTNFHAKKLRTNAKVVFNLIFKHLVWMCYQTFGEKAIW